MSTHQTAIRTSPDEKYAFYRRRDHANIEAMTGRILQAIGYPTKRHRDFICALQSAHGGGKDAEVPYTPFRRAHLTLAQFMQIGGTPESQRKAVYREITVLRNFSKQTGILLFHVTPGNEEESTEYIDYLTPAADQAMQRALSLSLWKTNKTAAIDEAVEWVVAQLPRVEIEEKEKKQQQCNLLPLNQYELAQEKRICDTIEKVADEIERRGGDDSEWIQRLAKQLLRVADSRKRTAPARRDYATLSHFEELESKIERDHHTVLSGSTTGDNFAQAEECTPWTTLSAPSEEKVCEQEPSEMTAEPDMLAAAEDLARNGYAVIPLYEPSKDGICTCRAGASCDSPGKHPRISAWQQKASRDPRQIRKWWEKWPKANIGIATGSPSACIVLDIDVSKGGGAGFAALLETCDLPDTLEIQSGSGAHLYFAYEGEDIKNSACKIGEGLDIRGQGGFIVACPSFHASGRRYQRLNELEPAPLPEGLRDLLLTGEMPREIPHIRQFKTHSAPIDSVIPKGQRNDWLFRKVACRLRAMGADMKEIRAALDDANSRCIPPLPMRELDAITKSAIAYPPGFTA